MRFRTDLRSSSLEERKTPPPKTKAQHSGSLEANASIVGKCGHSRKAGEQLSTMDELHTQSRRRTHMIVDILPKV